MYRNIFYNPRAGTIKLFTWNDQGDRTEVDYPFKPYVYVESSSFKDAISIFNTTLRKIEFKNQFDRRRYVQESGIKRIFYNIPVEQQFLIDQFGSLNADPKFSQYPLKIFYIDIETYSPDKFPEPKLAEDPINLITIKDSLKNEYHTFGLEHDYKPKKENVVYHKCISETDLLRQFIRYWQQDYPDIVTGWNTESFDIPYLLNRITNLLGEDWAKKLSPVGNIYSRDGILKRFGKVESKWYIKGVSLLDYLECYKTFSRAQRESYSLDNIAEAELGEGKLSYNATSLSKLADTDWETFVDYNIRDADIVARLEEKLRYLQLCRMLGYKGLTQFEGSLGTIAIVTGAMALAAQEKGMIIPTFNTDHRANYAGGYVKEPNRGLKEGIISFDANSLYPNTIITLNISPETKLGKIIDKTDKDVTIMLVSGKEYKLPLDKFVEFVKKEKVAISKAKTLYTQKTKGFCPELVEGIYEDRVKNKNALKEHKKAIAHCKKDSEKYIEHEEMINHLDIMQYTLKILMNRIYGTFANKHSPFCDVDAASSITLTGQACVKTASEIVNNHCKQTYGVDDNIDLNIYSDTDSCYFTIQPILDKIGKSFFNPKGGINRVVYDVANDIEDTLNNAITLWAGKSLNSYDPRFVFKREAICDAGIFIQKKRYILHVLDDEGIEADKYKYIGVEVASTATPKAVKPLIKRVVETMVKTKDYKETNKVYMEAFEEFKKLPIEEIAFPRGVNGLEKYATDTNTLETKKRTPCHVKAAMRYNYMLKKCNVENKYEPIKSGIKIKFFYTRPNRYGISEMAFINEYPEEFKIEVDKEMMFKKTVYAAVERLYNVVNWRIQDPNSQAAVDLFDLLA